MAVQVPLVGGDVGVWGGKVNDALRYLDVTDPDSEASLELKQTYALDNARWNVRDYGAVGDGVADDTLAFNDWLDALVLASGDAVGVIPAGKYRLTSPLTRRDTGVSLTIRGEGARQTMLFGDFVGAGAGILDLSNDDATSYSTTGHRVSGLGFVGRGTPGDPVGLLMLNAFECVVDDIDAPYGIVVNGIQRKALANSVVVVTNDNNSKWTTIRSQGGWQPQAFDTADATASFTSGSPTVTASAGVFTAAMVGSKVYFASGSDTGSNAIWSATILTVDTATQVTLDANAPSTAAGVRFGVGLVTGSTTAGSKTLTLDSVVGLTSDYVGMQIHVFGASDKTDASSTGLLSTTIESVVGNTVTMAQPATLTVASNKVLFAPALFVGSFEGGATGRQTNHSWWRNVHMEGFACAGIIVNKCIYANIDNLKIHGAGYGTADDWDTCIYPAVFSEIKQLSIRGIQAAYGIEGNKLRVVGSRGILILDNVEVGHLVKDVSPFHVGDVSNEFRLVLGDVLLTYPLSGFDENFDVVSAASGWSVESKGSLTHRTKHQTWSKRAPIVAPGVTGQHSALVIEDDSVATFRPPGTYGTLRLVTNAAGVVAEVHYRTSENASGAYTATITSGANAEAAVSPANLTGITGTDGKVTIAAGSDGLLYIENRRGFPVRVAALCSPFGY